jgi:transketolase
VLCAGAYNIALAHSTGPSVLALSRQNVPNLETSTVDKVKLGAYTVFESSPGAPLDAVIVATGSEVGIALDGAKKLEGKSVRVVSMPCTELFDAQSEDYRYGAREAFPVSCSLGNLTIVACGIYCFVCWNGYVSGAGRAFSLTECRC